MLVRRPLIGVALCYMVGLGLARVVPPLRETALAAAWILLFLAAVIRFAPGKTQAALCTPFLLAVVLLVGWLRVAPESRPGLASCFPDGSADDVVVTGVVRGDPLPDRDIRGQAWRFPLEVARVGAQGRTGEAVAGRVDVLWFGRLGYGASPAYGERWQLDGPLRARRWGGRQSAYLLVSSYRESRRLSRGFMARLVQICLYVRHRAAETLRIGVHDYPDSVGIVHAMLLGYRSELARDVHDLFVRTGTLHVFAISGLHVGIVVGVVVFALTVAGIPRQRWLYVVTPLLIAYTLMTGMKPSAMRASIMAVVFLGATALNRRADSISALAFASLLLLALAPEMMTALSFVLSFAVVGGILLLFPFVDRWLRPLWARDPFIIEPESRRMRLLRGAGRYVAALVGVSVSAWLVSAPLIATCFGRIAPVALLANVFVVPMAFLIVLAGALSIVAGFFVSHAADLFNHANVALTHVMLMGLKGLALVPGGSHRVGEVGWYVPAVWYALLMVGLLYLHGRCTQARRVAMMHLS